MFFFIPSFLPLCYISQICEEYHRSSPQGEIPDHFSSWPYVLFQRDVTGNVPLVLMMMMSLCSVVHATWKFFPTPHQIDVGSLRTETPAERREKIILQKRLMFMLGLIRCMIITFEHEFKCDCFILSTVTCFITKDYACLCNLVSVHVSPRKIFHLNTSQSVRAVCRLFHICSNLTISSINAQVRSLI